MVTKTIPELGLAPNLDYANVRSGPSISYDKETIDDQGKKVNRQITDHTSRYEVLGKYHTGESGNTGTWWQIQYSSTEKGWVRGDLVTLYNVDDISPTWQPYTATLRTGSLALPFAKGIVLPITSLFDDPRRGPTGWDPEQRNLPIHNGIDWATAGSVYAMAAGQVSEIVDVTEGNDLGTYVKVQSDGFHITYGHLAEVDQGLVNEYNNTKTVNPRVNQGQRLGTAGETGNADGVHLHAQLKPDYLTEIPANHKHIGGAVNFQQYLPAGHYHWPDIAALQAEINDASEDDRDDLGRVIDHWMDNVLQGEVDPDKARLMVTPGRSVYMLPRVDENYAYPCRLFPGSAIIGMNQVMWELFHSLMFADAIPIPEWWRIRINPSFPACWVRNEDAEEIGDWHKARLASPSLLTDLPRYLQKASGTNVRSTPRTDMEVNGRLTPDTGNTFLKREGGVWATAGELVLSGGKPIPPNIQGWVPILDLACDATTGTYLWYQIPFHNQNPSSRTSNATGWVRGDVVDELRGTDPDENTLAFPDDDKDVVKPKVPWLADTAPQASTGPDQKVSAHIFPDMRSPGLRGFAGTTRIRGIYKGISPLSRYTWYQLQLANARRGWVRADQVQTYHTNGLSAVQPRLRRRSGHTAAVPVLGGPSPYETVRATIAADSTAWHNLLGRDAAYPGWWQIQYDDTVTGWVEANDAVETEGNLNSAPPPRVGLANSAQACVVRSQPTATATELGTIAAGSTDLHPVLERDAVPAAWYRIRYSDTVTGWVSAACVQLHGDGRNLPVRPQASLKPTVTSGVRVRRGPGLEHAWIGSIPGGSTVRYDILGQDADPPLWWQIQFSDTVSGWVHKDNMLTHGSLEHLAVTWIPQLSPRADATAGLNVHAGPGTHHRVLVTLPAGATRYYDILGKDAATAAWYQIRVSALLIGWVPREYVQTRGPLADLPVTWTGDPQVDADPAAESGTSLNQAEHHNGTYTLDFNGSTVSAEFSSSASPVQYFARADQGRAPVFRILDPDLRPAEKAVLSTDTAQEVNRDGSTKTGGVPRTLKLEVHTDGNVYYVDEGLRQIGYLDYEITGSWTPAGAVPRERGVSLNQTEHHDGDYTLTVRDDTVHAVFASSSSPVQYFARADQGRAPVFRIADAALRPEDRTILTVTGAQEVNRDGTPKTGGVDRTFKLEVHTDGNVYYVDEDVRDIGYLDYRATGSWPLTPVETPAVTVPRPPATRPVLESGRLPQPDRAPRRRLHPDPRARQRRRRVLLRLLPRPVLRPRRPGTRTRLPHRGTRPAARGQGRPLHRHRAGGQPRRHPQDRRTAPHPQAGGAAQRRGPLRGRGPAPDRLPELQRHRLLDPRRRHRGGRHRHRDAADRNPGPGAQSTAGTGTGARTAHAGTRHLPQPDRTPQRCLHPGPQRQHPRRRLLLRLLPRPVLRTRRPGTRTRLPHRVPRPATAGQGRPDHHPGPRGGPRRQPPARRRRPHPQAGGAHERQGLLRGRGPARRRLPEVPRHRQLGPGRTGPRHPAAEPQGLRHLQPQRALRTRHRPRQGRLPPPRLRHPLPHPGQGRRHGRRGTRSASVPPSPAGSTRTMSRPTATSRGSP